MASKLEAKLGLSTTSFGKGIDKAKSKTKELLNPIKTVQTAFKSIGGTLAGVFAVGAIKGFINELDALGKRARDLDMRASQLQEFQHQAKLAGIETGALDASLKAFNRNMSLATMGTGEAVAVLKEMGIKFKDVNGAAKTQSELLKETAKYFAQNAGAAGNAGKAAKIFGESGVELLRIFEQGDDVINGVFEAKGIDEASAAAENFNDALENVMNTGKKWFAIAVDGWSKIETAINGVSSKQAAAYEKNLLNLTDKQADMLAPISSKIERLERNRNVKRLHELEDKGSFRTEKETKELNETKEIPIVKQYNALLEQRNKLRLEAKKASNEERAEAERLAKVEADRAEAAKKQAAEEKETAKMVAKTQKENEDALKRIASSEKKILDLEKQGWSTKKKLLEAEKEMADIQEQMSTASSLQERADAQEKYADKLVEIAELQQEHDDEMQKRRDDAKDAEKELQDLYKERKGIFKEIADKAKEATDSTLKLAGEKGKGKVGSKMRRSKEAEDLAEQALADGRMNDYFKYSDRAKGLRDSAAEDRKSMLEDKGARALEKGDMETYNRLKGEYEKKGFGQQEAKGDQADILKENLDNTTKLKELLEELVGGLKDG